MKIKYEPTYKGYLVIPKAVQMLLRDELINFTQLGAYICFVMQSDFDKRHKNHGVIIREDEELAKGLGCNQSTIYRLRKILISKKLLIEKDGNTGLPNPYVFTAEMVKMFASQTPRAVKNCFLDMQQTSANNDSVYAKTKSITTQIPP